MFNFYDSLRVACDFYEFSAQFNRLWNAHFNSDNIDKFSLRLPIKLLIASFIMQSFCLRIAIIWIFVLIASLLLWDAPIILIMIRLWMSGFFLCKKKTDKTKRKESFVASNIKEQSPPHKPLDNNDFHLTEEKNGLEKMISNRNWNTVHPKFIACDLFVQIFSHRLLRRD